MKRATLGSALVAIVLLLIAQAPAVSAHTELLLSDPADGAYLDAAPTEVLMTFSEDLLPETVNVSVADGNGMVIRVLDLIVDGAYVTVSWPAGLTGPDYTVNYRVVSQDGHPVSGSVSFTAGPAASSPAPGASSVGSVTVPVTTEPASEASALPVGGLAAIAGGLAIGIAIGFVVMLRRRGSGTP